MHLSITEQSPNVPALSEDLLHSLYLQFISNNQLGDVLMAVAREENVLLINQSCKELLGYEAKELTGKPFRSLVHAENVEMVAILFERAAKSLRPETDVIHLLAKNGSSLYLSFLVYWQQQENLFFCIGRNISQLKEAERKRISTENLLQALIENSFEMVGLLDENFNYLFISDSVNAVFNSKADALFGQTADQLLGKNCIELVHPDDQQRLIVQIGSVLTQNKKIHLAPYRVKDNEGRWHWLEAIVSNQLANPDIKAIVVSAREITQQVENERKLKELQLSEALMEGEEKERTRIAGDLHDEISGMIAAAKMHFGAVKQKDMDEGSSTAYLQGMQLLDQAAQQVRRTSHSLMPEILLAVGLDEALRRYCGALTNQSVRIQYVSVGQIGHYAPKFELAIYRIVQELLNNILKHAGATEAMVQASCQDNMLLLTVEDNGKGFDLAAASEGTGLSSVQRRVEAMGGYFQVVTQAGKGTSIYLEFELEKVKQ